MLKNIYVINKLTICLEISVCFNLLNILTLYFSTCKYMYIYFFSFVKYHELKVPKKVPKYHLLFLFYIYLYETLRFSIKKVFYSATQYFMWRLYRSQLLASHSKNLDSYCDSWQKLTSSVVVKVDLTETCLTNDTQTVPEWEKNKTTTTKFLYEQNFGLKKK